VDEAELRKAVDLIQGIVDSESGARLGDDAERALAKILRNVASGNLAGADGFSTREVTVLFADIRGFTSITARNPAATVLGVVNRCLITMSEIVSRHGGTIDKFMGDAIMVLFQDGGAAENAAQRAVHCALDMQIAMEQLNAHYKQFGLPQLYLGVGINTGAVTAGVLGSNHYSVYTVIGEVVNLASRIEAFSLRGQVLISQQTLDHCRDFIETGEPLDVHVKGKPDPVRLVEVLAIPSRGKEVPRREFRRSPRVLIRLPFSYQLIENKIASPQKLEGMIADMGYYGVLIETARRLDLHSEMKLSFDLPLVGARADDVYGMVVKTFETAGTFSSGIEFTSLSEENRRHIRLVVQLLIQGGESR
jgi:adenylate cyclase